MLPCVWEYASVDGRQTAALASALGISPIIARLLCLRGLGDADSASRFLHPSLGHLHDPYRLADMAKAVERILNAVSRGERIAIHGDYDVDGVTATVILRRTLEMLGANVVHYLPERLRDGYGLQPDAITRLRDEGASLVITVDCGIRGLEAARRAQELGIDLIVTDHHEPATELPPALAVINPRRPGCTYPDKNLAGVGVALKLVQALCSRTGHEQWVPSCVKLAAIGTVADVVPLLGENRVIAKLGLEMLSRGPHKIGLRALIEAAGLAGRTIDSYHVAFMLAPRVNAAGRMSTPDLAMRLLMASDETMADEARNLAAELNAENVRRQREEQNILAEARRLVDQDPEIGGRSVLVVANAGWHRGVIGIVAAKLVEAFYRPAIVISVEDGLAHGSCRSVPTFDMLGALEQCADHLVRYGGHRQAAGLTIETSRVAAFREAINLEADRAMSADDLRPRLRIDASLSFGGITGSLFEQLDGLEPYGQGNPRPVFSTRGVQIVDGPRRLKERHLKMTCRQEGRTFRAVAWRAGSRAAFFEECREGLDLAFSLVQNDYNGARALELSVADARRAEPDVSMP